MKTLIFGAGFLGERFARELPHAKLVSTDIADRTAVAAILDSEKPTAIVNCAGKTGRPNVDWCESHPLETMRSNVEGPLVLAEACAPRGIYMLHMASGCIFYGPSPSPGGWRETDFANPSALYSKTKYAADLLLAALPNVGIARLRMPIDDKPHARNLITKLAAYKQVVDVENSVTVVEDLVAVTTGLVAQRATGVFHCTNPGAMRHRALLGLYKDLVDPHHTVELISEAHLVEKGLAQKARSNCILADTRLAELGLAMRPIDVALRDCMTRYAKHHPAPGRDTPISATA